MFCTKCGDEISEETEYCPNCGCGTKKTSSDNVNISTGNNNDILTTLDNLESWIKIIICIFAGSVVYGLVYRILKGNVVGAILMFLLYGIGVGLIIDLVTIIQTGKPTVLC